MEVTDFIIPLFVAFEVVIILALYRYVIRDWIIEKWEEKLDEEGWLIVKLEPVIDEIEDRIHDKLEQFQSSFFGSIGKMTANAKNLDPMNNLRKAAKSGDWPSMLVEYAANKAGIGGVLGNLNPKEGAKEPETTPKIAIPKPIKDIFKL